MISHRQGVSVSALFKAQSGGISGLNSPERLFFGSIGGENALNSPRKARLSARFLSLNYIKVTTRRARTMGLQGRDQPGAPENVSFLGRLHGLAEWE